MPDHAMAFPPTLRITYTPGPWRVQEQGRDWGCAPGRQHYARLSGRVGDARLAVHQVDGSDDEYRANLRLLLAAPDLLTALKSIMPFATIGAGYSPNLIQQREAIEAARSAIAKAEGSQP